MVSGRTRVDSVQLISMTPRRDNSGDAPQDGVAHRQKVARRRLRIILNAIADANVDIGDSRRRRSILPFGVPDEIERFEGFRLVRFRVDRFS